jgi:FAD-dependent urate hydroxylase
MNFPDTPALHALTQQAQQELAQLAYPNRQWVLPLADVGAIPVHDVVVVGGGQAGLATAFALRRDGVQRVLVLDTQPAGQEGVWENFARMTHLRTPKHTIGIEGGVVSLSAPSFYKAAYGELAWAGIDRIERTRWMAFLRWFRHAAGLEVENDTTVVGLAPYVVAAPAGQTAGSNSLIELKVASTGNAQAEPRSVFARHVVLATGFDGCGGWRVPAHIAQAVAPKRLNHSNEPIDFKALAGKRVGILGHGASAFDNACIALEQGAASVDVCFRREKIPTINPHRRLEFAGFLKHFFDLDDLTRWSTNHFFEVYDQPPTQNGWDRAHSYPQFAAHAGSPWLELHDDGTAVHVRTPHGQFTFDHVICATGAAVDYEARPELQAIGPVVKRWRHVFTPPADMRSDALAECPYLGPGFEYQALDPVAHPWVKRVKAFNFSSVVSMGPHTTSASGHKYSIPRLVSGITAALMKEQASSLMPALYDYDEVELRPKPSAPALHQMAA